MIPPIFHYCFGMSPDFGGMGFSFVHYLSVLLSRRVAGADRVLLHYHHEPKSPWWDRTLPLVEQVKVDPPTEVYGNPVDHPAHRADLVRLRALDRDGGVYLDMDAWPLRPFTPFEHCDCVLGLQGGSFGLCNAVIAAAPGAEFIRRWLEEYADFNGAQWDEHSVRRPLRLASENPHWLHIQPDTAFFWPYYNDPYPVFYEDEKVFRRQRLEELRGERGQRARRYAEMLRVITGKAGAELRAMRDEHLATLRQSYAIHLWESKWHRNHLSKVSPEWLAKSPCVLATRVREALGPEGLAEATGPRT